MNELPTIGEQAAALQATVNQLRGAVENLVARQRRQRVILTLTIGGLIFDLTLTLVFRFFFYAEVRKVAGQIDGINQIDPPPHSGITRNPRKGVERFRDASQHYLNHIHGLNNVVDVIASVAAVVILVGAVVWWLQHRRGRP